MKFPMLIARGRTGTVFNQVGYFRAGLTRVTSNSATAAGACCPFLPTMAPVCPTMLLTDSEQSD
jgi:hypothetical protein